MAVNFKNNDFDAQSYIKVNDRLREFWEKFPQGRINTTVTELQTGFLVKTSLCKDSNDVQDYGLTGVSSATGHAFIAYNLMGEKVLEFTETVSLGRALAILGFKIEKSIASSEEMDRFTKMKGQMTPLNIQEASNSDNTETVTDIKLKTVGKFNINKFTKES